MRIPKTLILAMLLVPLATTGQAQSPQIVCASIDWRCQVKAFPDLVNQNVPRAVAPQGTPERYERAMNLADTALRKMPAMVGAVTSSYDKYGLGASLFLDPDVQYAGAEWGTLLGLSIRSIVDDMITELQKRQVANARARPYP